MIRNVSRFDPRRTLRLRASWEEWDAASPVDGFDHRVLASGGCDPDVRNRTDLAEWRARRESRPDDDRRTVGTEGVYFTTNGKPRRGGRLVTYSEMVALTEASCFDAIRLRMDKGGSISTAPFGHRP